MSNDFNVSAALYCQQYDIDVKPEEAWVLQNIDGECYLEKVLRRFESFGIFKKIFLLVGDEPGYEKYTKYAKGELIKVIRMRSSDYQFCYRYTHRAWNITTSSGDPDFTPVWLYQVMLSFNEDILYSDSIYNGFVAEDVLREAIEKVCARPDYYGVIRGQFGSMGKIFTRQYLRDNYFRDQIVGLNKKLSFTTMANPISINEGFQKKLLNFESLNAISPGLHRKECFEFMKEFYLDTGLTQEKLFRESFEEYFLKNGQRLNKFPKVLRVNPVYDQKEINIDKYRIFLKEVEDLGRLSVVMASTWSNHSHAQELLSLHREFNLHSILETDGDYAESLNDLIGSHWNILIFLLDEINPKYLAGDPSQTHFERKFLNFFKQLHSRVAKDSPQIGIHCNLTRDDQKNQDIIAFWRSRLDYIPFFNLGKDTLQGHIAPCIQFVKYYHPDVPSTYSEGALKDMEICYDHSGAMFGQIEIGKRSLRDFFESLIDVNAEPNVN